MESSPSGQVLPESLAGHPWRDHAADLDGQPPTMLQQQELQLLHWLASSYFRREGLIVDAGCFLGGSTCALARGLAENPLAASHNKLIHSFDVFSTDGNRWFDQLAKFDLKP